jgi:hypothetical protein
MSDELLKTLRDYSPNGSKVDSSEMFTPRDPYGDDKFSVGNTNEPSRSGASGPSRMENTDTKPFSFALSNGDDGALIYYGCLLASVTTVHVKRENGKNYFQSQDAIPRLEYIPPSNLDADLRKKTALGWRGDVYAYWEADDGGNILLFDIRGPDQPEGQDISELNENLSREITDGKYYILIGSVDAEGYVQQRVSSDIPWFVTIFSGGSGSSSSSGGSSDSGGEESSGGSSGGSSGETEKSSNAIVVAPWAKGKHVALATMESNQVLFEFIVRDIPIKGRFTMVKIDPRFLYVCEPNSMCVASAPCGDTPHPVGAFIKNDLLVLNCNTRKDRRPKSVNVRLTGIRKGFQKWDMPSRTAKQKAQSEEARLREYDR